MGIPWDIIREDYLLSNDLRKEEVTKRMEKLRMLDAQSRGISVEQIDTTNLKAFYVLNGSYIDASLDAVIEKFGSIDTYIRDGLSLSNQEIKSLRNKLLED